MDWAPHSYRLVPRLHERWEARGKALPGFHTPHNPTHLLVYPEAVALTEVFCDLEWRRHIAMVREFQTANFYQHVAKRLNQLPDFALLAGTALDPPPAPQLRVGPQPDPAVDQRDPPQAREDPHRVLRTPRVVHPNPVPRNPPLQVRDDDQ